MALARPLVEPEETENRVTSWEPPEGWKSPMSGFFPEIPITDPDALFKREKVAFEAMLPKLKQQYPGSYVAVHDGAMCVIGASEAEVVRNFFERFGDTHVYIDYVGDRSPDTYQVSPFSF
jgi:hypothetical protein